MAMTRAQELKELVPGLDTIFGLAYKQYDQQWKSLYQINKSERSFEEDLKKVGLGMAAVKREQENIAYDNGMQEGAIFRYTHETIALGFAVTEEAMEDNLYVTLTKDLAEELAKSFAYTKNVKGAALFNNGFTTFITGDGKTMFATDHPLASGGVNANRPSVHADLNETSYEAACQTIWGWTNERGLQISAQPKQLFVPAGNAFNAERLTKTVLKQNSANNDINATNSMGVIPNGYKVNNFFTDPGAWFIKTDIVNGTKHFVRVPLKTEALGDFDSGNWRYKGRERYSFGVSDVLGFYGVSGT